MQKSLIHPNALQEVGLGVHGTRHDLSTMLGTMRVGAAVLLVGANPFAAAMVAPRGDAGLRA